MTEFIYKCLDLVFYPISSTSEIVLIPFFLLVFVFIVRLFYNFMHIGTR